MSSPAILQHPHHADGAPAVRAARTGAAFFDLDGTLVSTNLVHAYWYFARNNQGIWKSLSRAAATLARIPLFAATNAWDRQVFNEIFFRMYAGESEDRLRYLSEELCENVLKPAVYPGARDLIHRSKALGLTTVIISGAPGRNPADHRVRLVTLKRPADGFTWGQAPGQTVD